MEKKKGYYKQKSALWRSLRDGDFEEADVWAVLKERKDQNYSKVDQSFGIESPFQVQSSLNIPSPARMIPRTNSSSNNSTDGVQIPDWSKISNKKSKKKALIKKNHHDGSDDDDDDDDVYDCKVPPHEFIAERLAKSQISSFSVFEGVGRTLKGRDLSKVRNAVLTRTRFLE